MNSSIRAALAVGALALASSQSFASPVNVYFGMSPETVLTYPTNNPTYTELSAALDVQTLFTLVDTSPEVRAVNYELFKDGTSGAGFSLGSSVATWAFTDISGTATQTYSSLLLASVGEYVLKTWTTNPSTLVTSEISAVPLPAAAWLFGSALLGLGAMRRKQKAGAKSEMALA